MITLSAMKYTFILALVMLMLLLGGYVIYLVLIAAVLLGVFFLIRSTIKASKGPAWK